MMDEEEMAAKLDELISAAFARWTAAGLDPKEATRRAMIHDGLLKVKFMLKGDK